MKKSEEEKNQEEVKQEQEINSEEVCNETKTPESEKQEEVNPKSEIEIINEKLSDMQDKYLRLIAEFDNYKKRTLKEKMELAKSGGESVLVNILPIIDDIERASKSINETQNFESMKTGLDLILNKFKSFIEQNGVKEIETLNALFNTDIHEAVTKIPANDESMKGKVVDVIQKGYLLHDKVIRFAKVVVGE